MSVRPGGWQLIPAAEARARLAAITAVVGQEEVALEDAAGRVLARDTVAAESIPAAPRAVMDGYAVRAADTVAAAPGHEVTLALAAEVRVGTLPQTALGAGQAARIATGGCLPEGADAVVPIERARNDGALSSIVFVAQAVHPGQHVLPVGADVAAGRLLIARGQRLRPAHVGALASLGFARVPVFARVRVAVLSSGNEVRPPGEAITAAQVRDSNQYVLGAQAAALGCRVTHGGIVSDDPARLEARIRELLLAHDVVMLSAGTSVGERDYAATVIERLGQPGILFHGVDVRPGKPALAAFVEHPAGPRFIFGMPGFPTSAAITFEMFVASALRRLAGEDPTRVAVHTIPARLTGGYESARGREDYLRVSFLPTAPGGERQVRVTPGGPASLSNFLGADGLVVVAPDAEGLPDGAWVQVRLLQE